MCDEEFPVSDFMKAEDDQLEDPYYQRSANPSLDNRLSNIAGTSADILRSIDNNGKSNKVNLESLFTKLSTTQGGSMTSNFSASPTKIF
jgi:hypothetical protein